LQSYCRKEKTNDKKIDVLGGKRGHRKGNEKSFNSEGYYIAKGSRGQGGGRVS